MRTVSDFIAASARRCDFLIANLIGNVIRDVFLDWTIFRAAFDFTDIGTDDKRMGATGQDNYRSCGKPFRTKASGWPLPLFPEKAVGPLKVAC